MNITRRFIVSAFFICACSLVFAQVPTNDNCTSAITLISDAGCTSGTVYQSTTQGGEQTNLPCTNGSMSHSIWYKFVATAASMYIQIYKTDLIGNGNGYTDSRWAIEVYNTSTCIPSQANEIGCANANTQGNHDDIMELNFTNLTIGSAYLIQVIYKPGNGAQVPQHCISVGDNYSVNCNGCNGACGAACIFSSVPSTNEQIKSKCSPHNQIPYLEGDQTTSQCYTFTATNAIMNFGVLVNSNCSGTNTASFNWTLYNNACGSLQTGTGSSKMFTGLTIGASYTFCYTITSLSSCYHTAYYPYVYPNQTLPVELSSFTASQKDNSVLLSWETESELNNKSFTVQRSTDGMSFQDLTTIEGSGTSTVQHSYSFVDSLPIAGTAYYRLKQVDFFTQEPGPTMESNGTYDSKLKTLEGNDDDVTSVNFSHIIPASFQPQENYRFNLTAEKADISLFAQDQSMVFIFDEQGMVIYRNVVNGPVNLSVPIKNKHGIWYACLIHGDQKELMRSF